MIVSPSRKFIFVHIPKNAGTTVETLLMKHLDPNQDLHVSEAARIPQNRAVVATGTDQKLLKHIKADRLEQCLQPGLYRSLFSFAISRNPYSRCFSAFKYMSERAAIDLRRPSKPGVKRPIDRTKFLSIGFDEICANLPEIAATHRLFRPQVLWLPHPNSVNFVGRLENLSDDLQVIYAHLGLPAEDLATLPTQNRKASKGAWREMSGASVDAIRAYYAEDFERYGYSTDFDGDDGAPARAIVPVSAASSLQKPARMPRPDRVRRAAKTTDGAAP